MVLRSGRRRRACPSRGDTPCGTRTLTFTVHYADRQSDLYGCDPGDDVHSDTVGGDLVPTALQPTATCRPTRAGLAGRGRHDRGHAQDV